MDQQTSQSTENLIKVELSDNGRSKNCEKNQNKSTGVNSLQWEKLRAKLDSGAPNVLENKMLFLILLWFSG